MDAGGAAVDAGGVQLRTWTRWPMREERGGLAGEAAGDRP